MLKTIYIQEHGHNGVTVSHYRTGKHYIEVEFGNKVGFYVPANRSVQCWWFTTVWNFILEVAQDEVLQPDESTGADENNELDDDLSRNSCQLDLLHCTLSVRRSIKMLHNEIPWPAQISSFDPENIIPECLYNLLVWIISGFKESDNVDLEAKQLSDDRPVHRQVISTAQEKNPYP